MRAKIDCHPDTATNILPYVTLKCKTFYGTTGIPIKDNNRYVYINGTDFTTSSDNAKFFSSSYKEITIEQLKERKWKK